MGNLHALFSRHRERGNGGRGDKEGGSPIVVIQEEDENITQLDLKNQGLTTLPTDTLRLRKLTWLGLNHNALETLPPEIGELSALTILRLFGNRLKSVPAELGNCAQVSFPHLSFVVSLPSIAIKALAGSFSLPASPHPQQQSHQRNFFFSLFKKVDDFGFG